MIRLFRIAVPGSVFALLVTETLLLFACFLLPLFWVVEEPLDIYFADEWTLAPIVFVVVMIQLGMYFSDLYENVRHRSTSLFMQQICLILGVSLLLQSLLSYV